MCKSIGYAQDKVMTPTIAMKIRLMAHFRVAAAPSGVSLEAFPVFVGLFGLLDVDEEVSAVEEVE
jgi:hypothetical protein